MNRIPCILSFIFLVIAQPLFAGEWSGFISAESRYFSERATDSRQADNMVSLAFQPEYYHEWDNRKQSLTFVPFFRMDSHDRERSHTDIRELSWIKAAHDWELRLGIRKVFWGVTESQHLVDIINQTDLVETPDGEEKLGQPMINLALIRDWGTLDLFMLPGFRERTFPGIKGRLRTQPHIDDSQTVYSHPDRDRSIDFAIRWSLTLGDWDIGLAHFTGTSRDPDMIVGIDKNASPVLIPLYQGIDQTSLDLQLVHDAWLWKLEAMTRNGQNGGRYFASAGGFEYTLYGIFDSDADLGIITEYHFDDRQQSSPSPFNNDLMLGLRLGLNDVQSSEALVGVISDLDGKGEVFSIEASRRFGSSYKATLEGRFFTHTDNTNSLYSYRNDDYLQLELSYYF